MKYNDNGTWKDIKIKAVLPLNVQSSKTTSSTDVYNCNYVNSLIDVIYPVGAIYMSVNNTNPGTLFGGTWEQIKDKFMLSAGDTYTAGATGGSASHKLTSAELPTHTHGLNSHTHTYSKSATATGKSSGNTGAATGNTGAATGNTASTTLTGAQSGTTAHSHPKPNSSVRYNFASSSASVGSAQYANGTFHYIYMTDNTGSTTAANASSGHTHGMNSHTHSLNSHTHSLNEHTHSITLTSTNSGAASGNTADGGFANNSFSTLPPYLAVYVWKRTA